VIGAGDFIGTAMARKFAAEGFVIFAGRRNGEKLASLVAEIEGNGGRAVARALDARKEDELGSFIRMRKPARRWRCASSTSERT